ncbi:MAG: hypothetical protein A2138_12070 [Deltaproteobacteria bacterium RBG_16_71_12]|nr:MAG: hypothetical protein A2138_12070 [Deltaproteobacteria bacterium RBG_16_71_12]
MTGMRAALDHAPRVAVAVSGGVDSLTLLAFATRHHGDVRAFHAESAAVPPEATARTRDLASALGVELVLLDVGELRDTRYASNPLDRCYICKSHLYRGIAASPAARGAVVLSGTNRDDLGDFRPGLRAADEHGVRHPFVEAGLGKAEVRELARALGLGALAELPAQPCLASRVETGIAIDAALLRAIDDVERRARAHLGEGAVVRCRVRAGRAELELEESSVQGVLLPALLTALHGAALEIERIVPYRRGSAFLRVVD